MQRCFRARTIQLIMLLLATTSCRNTAPTAGSPEVRDASDQGHTSAETSLDVSSEETNIMDIADTAILDHGLQDQWFPEKIALPDTDTDVPDDMEDLPEVLPATCLCQPCTEDSDCLSGQEIEARCVSFGPTGSYCASRCDLLGCPDGYNCLGTEHGIPGDFPVCIPATGRCGCSQAAVSKLAYTICFEENLWGTCSGTRECGPDGLTPCSAAAPESDLCDGKDNDCDGETDEDFYATGCVNLSEQGVCPGTTACVSGNQICSGPMAKTEICDGSDNDCDGIFDNDFADLDWDLEADCVDADDDGDGLPDILDNCPLHSNALQVDSDNDGLGDACDNDDDGDGAKDSIDCDPLDKNRFPTALEQCDGKDTNCNGQVDEGFSDYDHDKLADCVDNDDDNDQISDDADCQPLNATVFPGAGEICDGVDNDCSGVTDDSFPDSDSDGIADCVDVDTDADGHQDIQDNCPALFNPDQSDLDTDGLGDLCDSDQDGDGIPQGLDNCPLVANGTQDDSDANGAGDACSADEDGDGIPGESDNCKTQHNPDQADLDNDNIGDACDDDDDGDGIADPADCDPLDAENSPGTPEICDNKDNNCDLSVDEGFDDSDNDGLADCADQDDDQDGFADESDCAPLNPAVHPGAIESCNGIDDNCNSLADDGFLPLQCGEGQCAHSVPACAAGKLQACNPFLGSAVELCDGKDNDCDGSTDEFFDLDQPCTVGLGLCASAGFVVCSQDGESGECSALADMPDCEGKSCGNDGCGGSCGVCDDGLACTDDDCATTGQCIHELAPGNCLIDGQCRFTGESPPDNPCLACLPETDSADWSQRVSGWPCGPAKICFGGSCCHPAANCSDKECGPDGCGGSCGTCSAAIPCLDGKCQCVKNCNGKQCGPDGCGGSCGDCADVPGGACMPNGTCCAQQCVNKECGWDGCGLGCGSCNDHLFCTIDTCVDGKCQHALDPGDCLIDGVCYHVNNKNPETLCEHCDPLSSGNQWTVRPDGADCDPSNYNKKWICVAGSCCLPSCQYKKCGSDGCLDQCNPCPELNHVCEEGECLCVPDCDGKSCGPNGCMGECGTCSALEECREYQCVPRTCSDGNDIDWDGCTDNIQSEFELNTSGAGDQTEPAGRPLEAGGFVVIWKHQDQGQEAGEIRGRIVDKTGRGVGLDFTIAQFSGACEPEATIGVLKDDRMVAAWVDKGKDGKYEIRGQGLLEDGSPEGGMFLLSPEAPNSYPRHSPLVVGLPSGGFLSFYTGRELGTTSWYHLVGRYFSSAAAAGDEIFVIGKQGSSAKPYDAAALPDGRTLIVSDMFYFDSAYVLAPDVVLAGPTLPALLEGARHTLAGPDTLVQLYKTKKESNVASQLQARLFAIDGNPIGEPLCVHDYWDSTIGDYDVAGFHDGKSLVVWDWEDLDGKDRDVQAQLISAGGQRLGHRLQLNVHSAYSQQIPDAAVGIGNALVVWESCPHPDWPEVGQDGDGCGVFGRIVTSEGATCQPGECDASCNSGCDDSQPCTSDTCVPGSGCVHEPASGACGPSGSGNCHLGLCCYADCAGKSCGSDGCKGTCGSCNGEDVCSGGACFKTTCSDGNAIKWDGCSSGGISEFRLSAENKGDQQDPSVCDLPGGLYAAAWAGNGPGDDDGIFLRRFLAETGPVAPESLVNEETVNKQSHPALARAGNYVLVAWESLEQDGDDSGIYARYLDLEGDPAGPEFQVSQHSSGAQEAPVAVCRSDASCLLVFSEGPPGSTQRTTYLRWFDFPGSALNDQQAISGTSLAGINHDAVLRQDGSFVIGYTADDVGDNSVGVRLQLYAADSTKVGSEITANTFVPSVQSRPSMAVLSDGRIAMTWVSSGQDGHLDGVFALVFEADGVPVGTEFPVSETAAQAQNHARVVALPGDKFGVLWSGSQVAGPGYLQGVFWRRFNDSGLPTGASVMLNVQTSWASDARSAIVLSDGPIFAAWHNEGQDGFGSGVYGLRFDPGGARLLK